MVRLITIETYFMERTVGGQGIRVEAPAPGTRRVRAAAVAAVWPVDVVGGGGAAAWWWWVAAVEEVVVAENAVF